MKSMFCRVTDERALLAYCFKKIDNYYDLVSKVSLNDFLYQDHKLILTMLGQLAESGIKTFDMPMVINLAQESGVMTGPGDVGYLHSINDMPVSESNYETYVKNVLESSTKFQLYQTLQENLKLIEENCKHGIDPAELMGKVENAILDLSTASKAIKEPINMAEGLRETIEKRREHPVNQMGISTGFPILDKQIDGLVNGTLNVVSARPKKGKSTLLSTIAAHVAFKLEIPVLYIDTEMSFEQWRDRLIASMSNTEERIIKHGNYTDEQYETIIKKCVSIVENNKLFHEYMPGYSVEKIVALYKKYKIKHNIGLMVFDYIKEPESSSVDRQRKEYQLLGDVATKLKDLAGELDIPCLAAVQINREGNVADSDRIARYADIIMQWMNRTNEEMEGHPDGKAGQWKLVVRETRRGGMTPEEGIGFYFIKEKLLIDEVRAEYQLKNMGNGVINHDSDAIT